MLVSVRATKLATYSYSQIGVKRIDDLRALADQADEPFLTAEGALLDVLRRKDDHLSQEVEQHTRLNLEEVLTFGNDNIIGRVRDLVTAPLTCRFRPRKMIKLFVVSNCTLFQGHLEHT